MADLNKVVVGGQHRWFGLAVDLRKCAVLRVEAGNPYHELATVIANILQSIIILADGCANFRRFLIENETQPERNREGIARSLMLAGILRRC